jgi:transcriptional regulator GlxA family with amidase domain
MLNPKQSQPLSVRQVVLVIFEQAQLLDVAGPADVFTLANQFSEELRYSVRCASSGGGLVTTSSGLRIDTTPVAKLPVKNIDTLILSGGDRDGLIRAIQDQTLQRWVGRAAMAARRLAAVCSGSFALAQWGLLDGRRATTHWSAAGSLRKHYPSIDVEADSLFVQDGQVWTSGGVTSGIDMCLAMVEADHSRWLAARVAKQLVLWSRRVGNQAQYSVELQGQAGRYAEVVDWIRRHLREPINIAKLAARAGESERTFCRHFAFETGSTPAAFVEALRILAARQQLEAGASAKAAARAAGFTSDEHLARAFKRRLEMTPMEYRRAHQARG